MNDYKKLVEENNDLKKELENKMSDKDRTFTFGSQNENPEEKVDKKVIIDSHTVAYATSVKANPETNVSTTQTFDGAITQGMDKVAWSIELSKVRFEGSEKHKDLRHRAGRGRSGSALHESGVSRPAPSQYRALCIPGGDGHRRSRHFRVREPH